MPAVINDNGRRRSDLLALGLNVDRLDRLLGQAWLREANADDAAAITRVFNETVAEGESSPIDRSLSPEEVAQALKQSQVNGLPIHLLLTNGELAGFVMLRPFHWHPLVSRGTIELSIYLARQWLGRGLGGELRSFAFWWAARHGYRQMVFYILENNDRSLRLARAHGDAWARLPDLVMTTRGLRSVQVGGVVLSEWLRGPTARKMRARMQRAAQQHEGR